MKRLSVRLFALSAVLALAHGALADQIVIGPNAFAMEQYAAKELQRYLYQVSGSLLAIRQGDAVADQPCFIVGRPQSNPLIQKLAADGQIKLSAADPGPQGYLLKTLAVGGQKAIVIAANDEAGVLYGVYGLLEDYYGVGFFLGGDVLPDKKAALQWPQVDHRKTPAVAVRGFLPWTNFPQSATSYSWEDWRFVIDQMAKMRMNFLHIHNYNGQEGHNEPFHNFAYKGFLSRVWMPNSRTGHAWSGPAWEVRRYRFGAGDLFDDCDFGADCGLHNENLTNEQVFRKGVSEFQKVIAYAHSRGVKVGLGLDINLIPEEYTKRGAKASDADVVAVRVDQVVTDYPDLDYLLCFQSEGIALHVEQRKAWRETFDAFYAGIRAKSPGTRLAVAGWGIQAKDVASLPADVICAPISRYSAGCENGSVYGDREYWGCPWMERDFGSSEYYYPYTVDLSKTIAAWKDRAPNMKGFYCLTWRLTDAIDPKISWLAKAPWEGADWCASSEAAYGRYAAMCYGPKAAEAVTAIINENEPRSSKFAECQRTPAFDVESIAGRTNIMNLQSFALTGKDGKPVQTVQAVDFSEAKGPKKANGPVVGSINDGGWLAFNDVDFGQGAEGFEAVTSAVGEEGKIEVRLDGPTGQLLGACVTQNTGFWEHWGTFKTAITPTAGKHKVCLVFRSLGIDETEIKRADAQLETIDQCIAQTDSPARRARLQWLRCRIAAAREHLVLCRDFAKYKWKDLPGLTESWARNFVDRVTDISSLGNVMSTQNRYIQLNYLAKEKQLREWMHIQPPSAVMARGTRTGAVITWENELLGVRGFNVRRDGKRITEQLLPAGARRFEDTANGAFRYSVVAVTYNDKGSPPSVPVTCQAGSADNTPPHLVVISPPQSIAEGQSAWIKVRVLDGRDYPCVAATLYCRTPGAAEWKKLPMARRVKSVFAASIAAADIGPEGLEYYIEASDGDNKAVFPAGGAAMPLSLVRCPAPPAAAPQAPAELTVDGQTLHWTASPGKAFWYRIYRGASADFAPGADSFLTYVDKDTAAFADNGLDLQGRPLEGVWHYRVTAVDREDRESAPTAAVAVKY